MRSRAARREGTIASVAPEGARASLTPLKWRPAMSLTTPSRPHAGLMRRAATGAAVPMVPMARIGAAMPVKATALVRAVAVSRARSGEMSAARAATGRPDPPSQTR